MRRLPGRFRPPVRTPVRLSPLACFVTLALIGGLAACDTEDTAPPPGDASIGNDEGEPCSSSSDCLPKLVCAGSATCERPGEPGTGDTDDNCKEKEDCLLELTCGSDGKCGEAGNTGQGEPCASSEKCALGLVCSAMGTCEEAGAPGTKAPGQSCESPLDCAFGVVCLEGTCTPVALWNGADCSDDKGTFRGLFEIPRGGKPLSEFYRLPFPNDIRIKDGRVDITGHPNPAVALPKGFGEIPTEYLDRIGTDVPAWGVNTTVLMRVSGKVDLNSLNVVGDAITLQWFVIDPDSSRYGKGVGLTMFADQNRAKYICQNYITLRPTIGDPLAPGTTYAVLMRKGIKNTDGELAQQDADFKTVIDDQEPTDADEKAAWQAYAPLRAFLADATVAIDPSTVVSAAVFTTMDPRHRMARFRDAVHASAAPKADQLTLCDGQAKSPCDDGKSADHVCPETPNDDFDELQLVYQTPVFQQGTPPYLNIGDGGGVVYDASGDPVEQRQDEVCTALTLPKSAMPAEGWPVVIYAHGTGGSYRSFIKDGTAGRLVAASDAGGALLANIAVISIDGGMHGPRRGSEDDPEGLFFNVRNPAAARDNTYQAVADKFQLMRLIESFEVTAADSPTGKAIKLDKDKIYFLGHSQGTIEGTPFVAYEPGIKATLLSGAGGYLIGAMLNKTMPVNVAAMIQFILADGEVGTNHPLLNLFQLYFEETDTLNYGRLVFREPPAGLKAKHTFLSYGIADGYTPPLTIRALAKTMGLQQLNQSAERCGDGVCNGSEDCNSCGKDCTNKNKCGPFDPEFQLVDAPLSDNRGTPTGNVTAALVPYSGDGSYDDHFSIFRNEQGKRQSVHFFGSAVQDGVPTIPK